MAGSVWQASLAVVRDLRSICLLVSSLVDPRCDPQRSTQHQCATYKIISSQPSNEIAQALVIAVRKGGLPALKIHITQASDSAVKVHGHQRSSFTETTQAKIAAHSQTHKCFSCGLDCFLNRLIGMSRAHKGGLKLRWCQVNSLVQHSMKEFTVPRSIRIVC